jgi:heme ABC exporter ATP-binding subunit CcmA
LPAARFRAIGSIELRVTVDKLAKAYGFVWALRDLDLDLAPGDCAALLGPNGAGKTTLLKLLCGLIPPTQGAIRFDGAVLTRSRPELRARIGLLAPADHLYENLTARENLSFYTRLYGATIGMETLDRALAQVGLASRGGDYVSGLSSGMKCRLSIAKWSLLQPDLLLLDEPYGVLDGSGVDLLEAFLRRQCARGAIVVLASHHVSRALDLCSRALILSHGKLAFDETKQNPWPSFHQAFSDYLPRGSA